MWYEWIKGIDTLWHEFACIEGTNGKRILLWETGRTSEVAR